MISITVDAGDSDTPYLGKNASELQSNIQISTRNHITGTLHKIDSFEGFDPVNLENQSGHYLVLKLASEDKATIKTKIGDEGKEVQVDDGFCVYRIKDKNTQKIYVTAEKDNMSNTDTFDLSGLMLE